MYVWEVGISGCHSSSMLSARRAGIRGRQTLDGRAGAEVPKRQGGGPSVCMCACRCVGDRATWGRTLQRPLSEER